MGKGILLMVVATIIGGITIIFGVQRSALDTDVRLSEHQSHILAREIARSGANYGLSEILRDVTWRDGFQQVEHMNGHFDVAVVPVTPYSKLDVVSTGTHLEAEYQVITRVERTLPFQGALTFDSRNDTSLDIEVDFGGAASRISGHDVTGWDDPIHGVFAIEDDIGEYLLQELKHPNTVAGVGGVADIVSGSVIINIDELVEEAYAIEFANKHVFAGDEPGGGGKGKGKSKDKGQTGPGKDTYGTAADPAIVIIEGDFKPHTHFKGHGLLIILGDMNGQLSWNGLVIQYSDGKTEWTHKGNGTINGALWLRNWVPNSDDAPFLGQIDVDVFKSGGTKPFKHYHDYSTSYDVHYIDVANDPKLHFNPLVATKAKQVRAEFINTVTTLPVLTFKAGSQTHNGLVTSLNKFTFDPKKLESFKLEFAGALPQMEPEDSHQDPSGRNGAFGVRFINAANNKLLAEVTAYNHDTGLSPGTSKGGGSKKGKDGINATFQGASKVLFNSDEIWPLVDIFESLSKHVYTSITDFREQ